jgi:uncharacterized protein YjiS (DUF1127 family)
MRSENCTDTIRTPSDRPLGVQSVAIAWFAGRQLAWWTGRGRDALLTWAERAKERRKLATFNDHMLRDIGVTRADVMAETSKPFWRA